MNNKGQVLVLFLLVLPIVVGFLAFFIDISMVKYEKSRIEGITESNLKIILENEVIDVDKISNVFSKNDVKISKVLINGDEITINVEKEIKSIFGKVLDFDFYKLNISYTGNYQSDEIIKIR